MKPVLITAGATRNPIDSMRYISANASGRTGALLATELAEVVPVHVLCSPEALTRMPKNVGTALYGSTQDLCEQMEAWVRTNPNGLVIHSAAVGDYEVTQAAEDEKIPSGKPELLIRLKPTVKILDHIHTWSPTTQIVSFKAAPPNTSPAELIEISRAQLQRTGSILVFANVIGKLDENVMLIGPNEQTAYNNRPIALAALVKHVLNRCVNES